MGVLNEKRCKIIKNNFALLLKMLVFSIVFGLFQDIDNSLFGKYIFKNRYNYTSDKRKYKFVYRIGSVFTFCFIIKYLTKNETSKYGLVYLLSYLITSVISLYIQIILEEHREHINFIEKINNIKNNMITKI